MSTSGTCSRGEPRSWIDCSRNWPRSSCGLYGSKGVRSGRFPVPANHQRGLDGFTFRVHLGDFDHVSFTGFGDRVTFPVGEDHRLVVVRHWIWFRISHISMIHLGGARWDALAAEAIRTTSLNSKYAVRTET